MGLESATYLDDLVTTNPVVGDQGKTLADHIWLLKTVLQTTFPNIDAAVNGTPDELNVLAGVTPGTSAASKALVLDASSNLDAGTLNILKATTIIAANIKLQRGNQTDEVGTSALNNTSYVTASDLFEITPTAGLTTELEGMLYVDAQVESVTTATALAYISAGHVNSGGSTVEDGIEYQLRNHDTGGNTFIGCIMAIPVLLASTDLDASGNWSVCVRVKSSASTDTITVRKVYFRYAEYLE